MIKDLLSPLVLVGVVLATGALGGSFLFREPGTEATCPEVVPAVSRDAEAQILVDDVDKAMAVARGLKEDLQLYRVTPGQAGGTSFFLSQDEPPPTGPLLAIAYPRVGESHAYEIHPNVLKDFKLEGRMIQTLDDLIAGPSRARNIVQAQYPYADIQYAVLSRGTDCGLTWRVAGTISEEGKESLKLKARVDNETGQVTLPDGPPAPYKSLLDIRPWN